MLSPEAGGGSSVVVGGHHLKEMSFRRFVNLAGGRIAKKKDLSEYLNFYNKTSYMTVAKSIR